MVIDRKRIMEFLNQICTRCIHMGRNITIGNLASIPKDRRHGRNERFYIQEQ